MRIARFIYKKNAGWGILDNDKIRVLKQAPYADLRLSGRVVPFKQVNLLAPAEPSKIILIGLNYKDHARELKMPVPKEPVIFLKPTTSLLADKGKIIFPEAAASIDYEAELALVIKKKAKDIPVYKAREFIMGFCCLNDVTDRALQKKDGQWTRSKSFDSFCPLGPWLETGLDPADLRIRSYLNGKLKQNSSTRNFIFPVGYLVSFISRVMTLLPGDVISTGTPAGVGPMKPGDKIEIEIEGIGRLSNHVS